MKSDPRKTEVSTKSRYVRVGRLKQRLGYKKDQVIHLIYTLFRQQDFVKKKLQIHWIRQRRTLTRIDIGFIMTVQRGALRQAVDLIEIV